MAFFTKDSAPGLDSSEQLQPLSKDRVKAALDRESWNYGVDEDGDIGGGWEAASFYFFVTGQNDELFCIRGAWRGKLEGSQFTRAIELCNEWNSQKLWPKTYARLDEEGMVRLHTEHNVDFEQGVSDGQISQQLLCAINTANAFYDTLNEAYPEVWNEYKPEDAPSV
jgi:hypothetical protein